MAWHFQKGQQYVWITEGENRNICRLQIYEGLRISTFPNKTKKLIYYEKKETFILKPLHSWMNNISTLSGLFLKLSINTIMAALTLNIRSC